MQIGLGPFAHFAKSGAGGASNTEMSLGVSSGKTISPDVLSLEDLLSGDALRSV